MIGIVIRMLKGRAARQLLGRQARPEAGLRKAVERAEPRYAAVDPVLLSRLAAQPAMSSVPMPKSTVSPSLRLEGERRAAMRRRSRAGQQPSSGNEPARRASSRSASRRTVKNGQTNRADRLLAHAAVADRDGFAGGPSMRVADRAALAAAGQVASRS